MNKHFAESFTQSLDMLEVELKRLLDLNTPRDSRPPYTHAAGGLAGMTTHKLIRVTTLDAKNGIIPVKLHTIMRTMVQREPLTWVESTREKRTYRYNIKTSDVFEAIAEAKTQFDTMVSA
jgi:hypothetical protein